MRGARGQPPLTQSLRFPGMQSSGGSAAAKAAQDVAARLGRLNPNLTAAKVRSFAQSGRSGRGVGACKRSAGSSTSSRFFSRPHLPPCKHSTSQTCVFQTPQASAAAAGESMRETMGATMRAMKSKSLRWASQGKSQP